MGGSGVGRHDEQDDDDGRMMMAGLQLEVRLEADSDVTVVESRDGPDSFCWLNPSGQPQAVDPDTVTDLNYKSYYHRPTRRLIRVTAAPANPGGWEPGAEGSLGRKGAWGQRGSGADGSLGRMGVWGGWPGESGAEGSMGRKGVWGQRGLGRKGVWGGWEPGAEGCMGRKGVWGGREPPWVDLGWTH